MVKPLARPFDALVSYHYFHKGKQEEVVDAGAAAGVRYIGDSGAFSAASQGAVINIPEFAAWAHRHQRSLAWIASLDVIGDPEASWRNWRAMASEGVNAVPTVHCGTNPRELDRYADRGATFIGLGGMARRRDTPAVYRWLVSVFRYQRDNHPDMRFHGWGITQRTYLQHLPFWSVDSSGFGAGYRYGRVQVFDPETGKTTSVPLDGATPGAYGRLLRKHYGLTGTAVAKSHPGNRYEVQIMTALSAQHMAAYYRRRHTVTPPAGWEDHGNGPHVHFADADATSYRLIIRNLLENHPQPVGAPQ